MKSFRLIIILVTFFYFGCKVSKIESDLGSEIIICNDCGYGASKSPEIAVISKQYKNFDTTSLLNQFSDNSQPLLQFFSAICINEYLLKDKMKLNDTIETKFRNYKNSNEKVILSQGCTDHNSFHIRDYFSKIEFKEKNTIRELLGF